MLTRVSMTVKADREITLGGKCTCVDDCSSFLGSRLPVVPSIDLEDQNTELELMLLKYPP